jgi:hypothetical protein
MINLIDTYDSGRFLGSIVKTLQQTFPNVYVVAEYLSYPGPRNTVVIAAGKKLISKTLVQRNQQQVWIYGY